MYQKILLPIDLNHEHDWQRTLRRAVKYCQAFNAELYALSVVPRIAMPLVAGFFPADFEAKAIDHHRQQLATLIHEHVPKTVKVRLFVRYGTIYEEIIDVANAQAVDLIVVAASGPAHKSYLLGPNTERVVRNAKQSVLVIREE